MSPPTASARSNRAPVASSLPGHPTGRKIAFSGLPRRGGPPETIHVMNPDGSDVVDLGPPGECATWSPDSSKIMFCSHPGDSNWAVWVMNADGSALQSLPQLYGAGEPLDWLP